MIKEIVKDSMFLSMKSVEADVKEDQQVIQDLKDTLLAYRDRCVGSVSYTHLDVYKRQLQLLYHLLLQQIIQL